jgi:hypothetical protein
MYNMSIFHRTHTRKLLTIDVQIKFKGEKLAHTFTRNVNAYGVFIDLAKHGLVTNDCVEILFIDKHKDNNYVIQKGMVMHCSEEGVGIIFAYDTDEFRTMLNKIMMEPNTPQKISISSAH